MLETQLYKSASSLEAYLDRKTLKNRLGKLASAITSHYKEAVSSRRSSTRSSSSSIISQSSLGSLENSFSAARLRRSSAESLPSSSSFAPTTKLRREQSEPAIPSSSPTTKFLTKLRPEQSDTVVPSAKTISSTSESSVANASLNVPGNGRLPDMNVALVQNAPVSGVSSGNINPMAQQQRIANEQLQQQMLATMRQQQNIANQLKPNNAQQIMAAQAAMMGGNNGMVMMNQLQQQQNALNLNLMQQQALFQQRQQMLMASGNLPNNNGMNNMVNVSLPNVIPGEGAGNFQNFNNLMVSSDNTSMPPPTALRNVNANTPRRTPGGNDESSPLSPNSFRW